MRWRRYSEYQADILISGELFCIIITYGKAPKAMYKHGVIRNDIGIIFLFSQYY